MVQYLKKFKSQLFTGKVLYDFRDKAWMEPIQKKVLCPGLVVIQSEDWQLVFSFSLQGSGISSFMDKGSPNHKPFCICTKQ